MVFLMCEAFTDGTHCSFLLLGISLLTSPTVVWGFNNILQLQLPFLWPKMNSLVGQNVGMLRFTDSCLVHSNIMSPSLFTLLKWAENQLS